MGNRLTPLLQWHTIEIGQKVKLNLQSKYYMPTLSEQQRHRVTVSDASTEDTAKITSIANGILGFLESDAI